MGKGANAKNHLAPTLDTVRYGGFKARHEICRLNQLNPKPVPVDANHHKAPTSRHVSMPIPQQPVQLKNKPLLVPPPFVSQIKPQSRGSSNNQNLQPKECASSSNDSSLCGPAPLSRCSHCYFLAGTSSASGYIYYF